MIYLQLQLIIGHQQLPTTDLKFLFVGRIGSAPHGHQEGWFVFATEPVLCQKSRSITWSVWVQIFLEQLGLQERERERRKEKLINERNEIS